MLRTLRRSLAVSLIAAVPLAGCGGGSKSSSSTQTGSTASAAPSATGSSTSASPASVASAVTKCREAVAAAPNLTPALKAKAEGICAKAASGNVQEARKAAKEVCEEVINAQPVPTSVKEAARKDCASL